MKDFILWLIKAIVDHPDQVTVEETESNGMTTLNLQVAKEDMGQVIGKGGKIIKSLRNLLHVKSVKEGKRINLNLLEEQV